MFKQKIPIQIRFKDIDKMGHVNNANHITYFELARVEYFNEIATKKDMKVDWTGEESVILAKMEMEYKQPILMEDKVFCYTWVSRVGSKSFDMSCSIVRIVDGVEVEAARGLAIIVCFNYKTNQSIPVPEKWKQKILSE